MTSVKDNTLEHKPLIEPLNTPIGQTPENYRA